MELLVGQYLRFLHTVKAWDFHFVLYFPTRNLTFYGSHTVKIKWFIYNSSIYRQFTGVGFVNYTSLNFRKIKAIKTRNWSVLVLKKILILSQLLNK